MGWNIVKCPRVAGMQTEPHVYRLFPLLLRWRGWQWDDKEHDMKQQKHQWVIIVPPCPIHFKQKKSALLRYNCTWQARVFLVQPRLLSPGMVFLFRTMEACSQTASACAAWTWSTMMKWSGQIRSSWTEHERKNRPFYGLFRMLSRQIIANDVVPEVLFPEVIFASVSLKKNLRIALDPLTPLERKSSSRRWLSVPPDTKLNLPRTGRTGDRQESVHCASEMVQPNHSKPYLAKCDIEHIWWYRS